MKTWSIYYQEWAILAMALEGGWAIKCVPPARYTICTNWQAYLSLETALAGAKEYIDRAIALRVIGASLLELCDAGKLDRNECQGLLLSLEIATCEGR
ncbi:hypothetical protein NG798_04285 [Ancylothrix sp. C2]|uniref:hypothetical protein n=1 Tax=Ancylothrix sp. D3o TaxID=2953691 RepID=UPI0021BA605D|nr:hypothetical protein [Ancylothrix sp. D3o]MCT7948997.1 hypothetical protein [Ancylothrix sp. D3o]